MILGVVGGRAFTWLMRRHLLSTSSRWITLYLIQLTARLISLHTTATATSSIRSRCGFTGRTANSSLTGMMIRVRARSGMRNSLRRKIPLLLHRRSTGTQTHRPRMFLSLRNGFGLPWTYTRLSRSRRQVSEQPLSTPRMLGMLKQQHHDMDTSSRRQSRKRTVTLQMPSHGPMRWLLISDPMCWSMTQTGWAPRR